MLSRASSVAITVVLLAACGGPPDVAKSRAARPPTSTTARAKGGKTPNPSPSGTALTARDSALLPSPKRSVPREGSFAVTQETTIAVTSSPGAASVAQSLARWLGIDEARVQVLTNGAALPPKSIVLWTDKGTSTRDPAETFPESTRDEAFTLDVDPDRVFVRAATPAGLFYGAQAVAQLANSRDLPHGPDAERPRPRAVPSLHIEDAPSYAYRGMHLDVARHFFPRATVELFIDLLAFYRFNVFHWHLTDDQGFRLAVASHPELTDVGARRLEDGAVTGGYYTQDDARAIVAYAKERFITVIPEIEMPGHTRAILASHPELSCTGKKLEVPSTWGVFDEVLCAGNDATYKLMDDILGEVTRVFPSRIVHLGGDEVPKEHWQACAKCRARMQQEKLSVEGLQGYFLRRVAKSLETRGRRVMAWDEALDGGLPDSGVVLAWQGQHRGIEAARRGHDVVMAPHLQVYFDQGQYAKRTDLHEPIVPWTRVLAFDPTPEGVPTSEAEHVLGGEGTLWTERIKDADDLDGRAMPRMAALSEALWSRLGSDGQASSQAEREADFSRRFQAQRAMLDAGEIAYFIEPPRGLSTNKVFVDKAVLSLRAPALFPDGTVHFTTDGTEPTKASPVFTAGVPLEKTTTVRARLFLPNGRSSTIAVGTFTQMTPLVAVAAEALPTAPSPGVEYTYMEGNFDRVPEFDPAEAKRPHASVRKGRLASVGIDGTFAAQNFAVEYRGFVKADAPGVYTFVARADDGVIVEVDGVRVVEDDGKHAARDAEGEVALAQGYHAVRVGYFQGGHGSELSLSCGGPGRALGPCPLLIEAQ